MANIKISALPSVQPSGYTNDDLLVIVNYDVSSGTTKNTPLSGLTSYILSGVTFQADYLPLSGGTVTGDTIFNQGLTANTISASTYLGLPLDVYVTGGTYSGGTITFTNNSGGTFPVSGLTFTGNTSGDCITDLFVKNLNSCSPLRIQNVSSGDVLIGENGGVNVGIGTSTPTAKLHVVGPNSSSPTALFESKATNDTAYTVRAIATTTNTQSNVGLYSYASGGFANLGLWVEEGLSCFGPFNSDSKVYIKGIDSSSSNFGLKVQNGGGTNNLVVRNDGNVGIGTSTPNHKLSIDGPANTTLYLNSSGANGAIIVDSQVYPIFQLKTNNVPDITHQGIGSGNSLIDIPTSLQVREAASTITRFGFANMNSNPHSYFRLNVAFDSTGTIIPSANVHIKGIDSSSSNFGLKVQNSGGTNTLQVRNDGLVEFGDVSQPSNTWLQYTGGTLKLNYNTTSNFYWNGSDLKLTGLNGNGNSKLEFTSINAKQQTLIRCYNNERLSFATNAGSANMQLSSSGNLYIGDDTISGVDASSRLEIRGSGTTSSGYGLKVQDSSGTDNFVVRNDGNVGIGTSTPSEKLEVVGKIKTTNFQMTSGATTAGYVLTDSDGFGNAQWQPASGITGVGNVFKYTTTTAFTASVTQTITHNLNTKFVHCSVWDSSDQLVTAQVVRNSGDINNAVDITIATGGNYDILITG